MSGETAKVIQPATPKRIDEERYRSLRRDLAKGVEQLIVFTRCPEPGKCKTRLIPTLGAEGAANLQRDMTRHTLAWASQLARRRAVQVGVCYAGGNQDQMQTSFGKSYSYRPQCRGDLGRRLSHAFEVSFLANAERTVIVGTDCPGITCELVEMALDGLRQVDVVLGPATDGGYYLIGLRRPAPELFRRISWGSKDVLEETLMAARASGLSFCSLAPLADVDRPEDLNVWHAAQNVQSCDSVTATVSVIIPTLNEANCLEQTLSRLRDAESVETIVVDASSDDETSSIAKRHGCRVVSSEPLRAGQMNAGAAEATGSILLFLHADTLLPDRFDKLVREILKDIGVIAGAFRLRIDSPAPSLRLIETAVNIRSRWLGMPYGDQAIFIRANEFHAIGGFPDVPIMEDFELMRHLRRRGRVAIAPAHVMTSARRWERLGLWRTTWTNQMVILGYYLGVSPERLAQWYGG